MADLTKDQEAAVAAAIASLDSTSIGVWIETEPQSFWLHIDGGLVFKFRLDVEGSVLTATNDD